MWGLLGSLLLLPILFTVAAPDGITLKYIEGTLKTIVNSSHPGSAGNRHGYEDGSVVRVGNTTHMVVSEMFGDPMWIRMRLAHWKTEQLGGDTGWERVGTLILDGKEMVSTANCTEVNDPRHDAALWSPILFEEGGTWFMNWVGYNCGRGYSNANTHGQIKLAKSTAGVGGPFESGPILMSDHVGAQSWEGKQGVDSFFAYKPPLRDNDLLAVYGSSG